MLLGLLQYETDWEITSNAESGLGYSDILLQTPDRTGVVIEVKYARDGNLEKGCADALRQIEQKKYDTALVKDGMEKIVTYGIAFFKKYCRVVKGSEGTLVTQKAIKKKRHERSEGHGCSQDQ